MANGTKQPTVVGGINLSTRAKSPAFWTGTVASIVTFVSSILALLGVQGFEDALNQVTAITGIVVSLLTQFGVLVDPNSKGAKDSEIVQTDYTKPRDSKDPNEFVQWQANANTASTFELDNYENNAEPDSDDSDEVLAIEDEIDGGSAPSQDEEDTEEHGKVFAEEEVK